MRNLQFDPRFTEDILSGRKILTIRRSQHINDFTVEGVKFHILHVERLQIQEVSLSMIGCDGLTSKEELEKVWDEFYPDNTYSHNPVVFCHWFQRSMK